MIIIIIKICTCFTSKKYYLHIYNIDYKLLSIELKENNK